MSGVQISGVLSGPVHTRDIAHILDGAGLQEGVPGVDPLLRPAGDIEDQVVIGSAV